MLLLPRVPIQATSLACVPVPASLLPGSPPGQPLVHSSSPRAFIPSVCF